jgi:GAF domain-containing protein
MADQPTKLGLHPRIQRRRDLASSLNFPADLREKFGKFTDSERAVLKIISGEVGYAVVKAAPRTAKAEGLIAVERTGRHNTIFRRTGRRGWTALAASTTDG